MTPPSSEIQRKYTERRNGLKLLGWSSLALILAACGPESTDTPTATRAMATSTAAPTLAPIPTNEPVEAKPTIGPRGELLIGAEFESSGGQSTPFIYGERTLLPTDIPQELIDKYGFVANAEREIALKATAPDGKEFAIFGHPPTVNGKAYDRSSSRPDLGVFAFEDGIYLPGLIETNPDSQYFLASEKSSGKIVMIVRNQNGRFLVLEDRDPTLPGTQEWLLKAPKGANISIQAGRGGFITIGETTYSTSLPKLKPISEVSSANDCPLYTKDQILASPIDEQLNLDPSTMNWGVSSDSIEVYNSKGDKAVKILGCAKINFGPIVGNRLVVKVAIPGMEPNNPTIFFAVDLARSRSNDDVLLSIKSRNLQVKIITYNKGEDSLDNAISTLIIESGLPKIHKAVHDNFDFNGPNAKSNLLQILTSINARLVPAWLDSY